MGVDLSLFNILHGLANKSPAADWLIIAVAKYLIFLVGVSILMWAIYNWKKQKDIQKVFASVVAAYAITIIISFIFYRPRPFIELGLTPLIAHSANSSFPSRHAAASFAMAQSIFLCNKKFGVILIMIAVLISISRVFAGLHYVSDILAGAIIGIGVPLIINKIFNRKK